jgi:hypothetical protein
MKPMKTLEFCLLWDNFFVPEDLMVNKGKDQMAQPCLKTVQVHFNPL